MNEPFAKNDIKIALVGGGTGSFTLLSELKNHTKQLAAIVNMVDDGGSTGILRDELGTLPPGDMYSSLGPLLVIDGIAQALKNTKAICFYVCNLVTKPGQTAGFTVSDHAGEIERFVGEPFLDYVLYNKQQPAADVAHRYKEENAFLVKIDKTKLNKANYQAIAGNFLGEMAPSKKTSTIPLRRSLIRHDAKAVAKALIEIYDAKD